MQPITHEIQKVMANYHGKPILHYVVDYWSKYADDFVFITGYKREQVLNYIPNFNINHYVTIDGIPEKNGLADAVALVEPEVKDHFIVVLGDCFVSGILDFPRIFDQGVGVIQDPSEIYRNYQVTFDGYKITKVEEKPEVVTGDLCGMGCYFFKKELFDYIPYTYPSARTHRIELTDVIQLMIDDNNIIKPVFLNGIYRNVTYPEDLE
jgi:glucose-1-phosphate thymidylyltransferase